MAHEFIVKNGLISLGSAQITGSLTVTGNITVPQVIGTSSWANSSISSSYASSASWAPGGQGSSVSSSWSSQSFSATSASWASQSLSSSLSYTLHGLIESDVSQSSTIINTPILLGTVATNETHPHATIKVNGKLYCGGWDGKLYVLNDPDNDITNITTCSAITGPRYISSVCYSSVTGYLYFSVGGVLSPTNQTSSIIRVDPNDITGSQTMFYDGLPDIYGVSTVALFPIVTDGNYLYGATWILDSFTSGTSSFFKIDAITGVMVSSSWWTSASVPMESAHAAVISPTYDYFYVTTLNGNFAKVSTSDLSYTTIRVYDGSGGVAYITDDITYLNGKIYLAEEGNFYITVVTGSDLSYVNYNIDHNSYGIFNDGNNIYSLTNNGEVRFYPNADLASGPIRYKVTGTPNELWKTDGGRIITTNWTTNNVYSYLFPITQFGINKTPHVALDVGGTLLASEISSSDAIYSPTIVYGGTLRNTGSTVQLRQDGSIIMRTISGSATNSGMVIRYITASMITASAGFYGTASHAISASYSSYTSTSATASYITGGPFNISAVTPVNNSDVTTKGYVDGIFSGISNYYLSATASGIGLDYLLKETGSNSSTITLSTSSIGNDGYVFVWITPPNVPNVTILPDGLYNITHTSRKVENTNTCSIYPEIYIADLNGVEYYEVGGVSNPVILTTTFTRIVNDIIVDSPLTMSKTDRIVVKLKISNTGTNTIETQVEGNTLSHFGTPLSNVITNVATASVALTAISASYSTSASYTLSASYSPVQISDGGNYNITSSWSTNSLTASSINFIPLTSNSASWVSASVKITTADTASYITSSNIVGIISSASYALTSSTTNNINLSTIYVDYIDPNTVNGNVIINNNVTIDPNGNISASNVYGLGIGIKSVQYITSASYAALNPPDSNTLYVVSSSAGSTYPITASNTISASYALSASWAPGGQDSSVSSSWASSSISASYALSASWAPGGQSSTDISVNTVTASIGILVGPSADGAATFYVSGSSTQNIVEIDRYDGHEALVINNSGSVIIGNSTTINVTNPEQLMVDVTGSNTINVIGAYGTTDSYIQLNIRNRTGSISASTDIVATNDTGNETGNYVDLGINSSGYGLGFVGQKNDGYLYNTGSDFYIGNTSPNKNLYLFAGGLTNTGSIKIDSNGNITGSKFVGTASLATFSETANFTISASYANTSSVSITSSYSNTASYLIGGRTVLSAPLTIYVNTTGSDSNSGLSLASPLKSIQTAVNKAVSYDNSIYNITVQLSDGLYQEALTLSPLIGTAGFLIIQGNTVTSSSVTIQSTGSTAYTVRSQSGGLIQLNSLTLSGSAGGYPLIYATLNSTIQCSNMIFGAGGTGTAQLYVTRGGVIQPFGAIGYIITGGAGCHCQLDAGGIFYPPNIPIKITGTPTFTTFIDCAGASIAYIYSNTWTTGSVTGKKFNVITNGVINTTGGGLNYLPGNVAGTSGSGGQYV